MTEVLGTADAVGAVFRIEQFSGDDSQLWAQTIVDVHAGGVWTLQARRRSGTWVDTDVTHSDTGIKRWAAASRIEYRLSGGTIGGQASVVLESTGRVALVA